VLKAVLDTNVFISSLLNKTGPPAKLIDAWRAGEFILIVSPPIIIAEIKAVLEFPRIREKYALTKDNIEQLIDLLQKDTILVPGHSSVNNVIPQDPTDHIFLSCALDAGADVIVSGDRHLLNLKIFKGIPIITVIQFLDRLVEQATP
jgi:putative PIN family toxin of toxin-antitoxin system